MADAKEVVAKLQRIQELWIELGRTKLDSPEYNSLMKRIRGLSAEYEALVKTKEK
jgi:hypothetical protein